MTLSEMKDLLTYVWYLFLICLLIYMIIGIGYNFIKQARKEQNTQDMIDKITKEIVDETIKKRKK